MSGDFESLDTSSLNAVEADLDDALGHLRRPWVAPVRLIPWVGRQLNATDKIAEAGREVVAAGSDALDAIEETSLDDPVSALDQVSAQLRETSARLSSVSVPSGKWLAGPVAGARQDLVDNLVAVGEQIGRYEALVSGLHDLAASDSAILVAAANTSEMGSASGMLLQYGTMNIDAGSVLVSDFRAVADLGRPGLVPIDDDARLLWATLDPGHIWQYTSHLSSRASEVARITADMWLSDQGQRVDGVMIISPVAMQILLEAAGVESVTVDGAELLPSEVTEFFAFGQYVDYDEDSDGIEQRRQAISPVASAAVRAIFEQDADPKAVAGALFEAFDQRHLFLWSRSADLQDRWKHAGAAGEPPADSVKVALLNAGGNKLDRFVETTVAVTTDGRVRMQIDLANVSTPGLPEYVLGAGSQGRYLGHLVVSVPLFASDIVTGGSRDLNASAPDGQTQSLVFIIELDPGESANYWVEFDVPAEVDLLRIEPSGRNPAIAWTVDGEPRLDARSDIDLG